MQGRELGRGLVGVFVGSLLVAAVGCGSEGGEASEQLPGPSGSDGTVPTFEPPGAPPGDTSEAEEPTAESGMAAGDESMSGIINGTGMSASPGGAAPAGGVQVGMQCVPLCADASSDADADGFGFQDAVSCVVPGSAAAEGGPACAPMMMPDAPMLPAGDGFFTGEQCFPPCATDASDADAAGVTDGFGFELGASCIVAGSLPALAATPCIPEPVEPAMVPPGDGFLLGEQCFPPCVTGVGLDEQGFGFEQLRSCISPGSTASTQGIPCIPPPPEVVGFCPNPVVCPVVDGRTLPCGCGLILGFADRKRAIADAGGDRRFLASAMLETSTLTTEYPFGDVFPGPDNQVGTGDDIPKTGGAANFGLAKMNWTMIRQCHPPYAGLGDGDFLRGAELNDDIPLDVRVYNECRAFFGDRWFGGHRNGVAGLNNPNTADIRVFQGGVAWILDMLQGHELDDVQFFVSIEAI